MQTRKSLRRKATVPQAQCVACGCCFNTCPKGAIEMIKGVYASVEEALCVGCGLCSGICPASIIKIAEVAV